MLSGCAVSGQNASGRNSNSTKISVVAAEDFYGEVAKAVGGNHVGVTSIINKPSLDPHNFEPTSQTAISVSKANLVIYNGIGYDSWMDSLVSADKNGKAVIRVGEDLMHKKTGDNEHLWYLPDTMPKLASGIADQLAKIDPKHAGDYRKNAEKFQSSIKPIQDEIAKLKRNSGNKPVDVSEPVFDNMLKALGYKTANNHFELAVQDESDPSPQDIAQMEADIKKHRIAFFVNNIQANNPTVDKIVSLAGKNHVPVVGVTETLPGGKDYRSWMMDQLKQIEQIQNH